ncbi:MAG: UDP-N-acetylglucosamine 1-carboxyvinyltransferase [Candidatus Vogelbacteria bacterium]|nr:UDP-N-acetylglucosamine 1-carboxyvinyltransferase [Candidatus Vogelbacteria bacterium]
METQSSFQIEGLAGERKLTGEIKVGGAKNAALKVLAASVLFKDELTISRVPEIEDVLRMLEALSGLGVVGRAIAPGTYKLSTDKISQSDISPEVAKKMRSSIVLTGPLLARFGRVSFPFPGGCVIGKRPIDIFLDGYLAMGATVSESETGYSVEVAGGQLHGAEIFFRLPSVTATETFMMAAILAKGKTVLKNVALEPEIESLGRFLISCGAKIEGLGTPTIMIEGNGLLSGREKIYDTMPDRIEAGSFIILGALAATDLKVSGCDPVHLDALLGALRAAGVNFETGVDFVRIFGNEDKVFGPLELKTHEYPGFPTDLQAPMAIFFTQVAGQSFIFETIFEGRLTYLEAIDRMGAKARILDSHRAIIDGPTPLEGKEMESPDLRAGLAYLLAGIIAKGQTIVHNAYYIDRGYEHLTERLAQIGVNIKRLTRAD